MSNQSNIEKIDEMLGDYKISMNKLKNDFENLNKDIIEEYYNENNEVNEDYLKKIIEIEKQSDIQFQKLKEKNEIFKKVMPLTEKKYKKDLDSLKSNNKVRIENFNNKIDIEETQQITDTNISREKNTKELQEKYKDERMRKKLNDIKKDKEDDIDNIKKENNEQMDLINQKFKKEKTKVNESSKEKEELLLVEYSSELAKIQKDYTEFKMGLKNLKEKNQKIINDHNKKKKEETDKRVEEIKKINNNKYNKLIDDIKTEINKLEEEYNNNLQKINNELKDSKEITKKIEETKDLKNKINNLENVNRKLLDIKNTFESKNEEKINEYKNRTEKVNKKYKELVEVQIESLLIKPSNKKLEDFDSYYNKSKNEYIKEIENLDKSTGNLLKIINEDIDKKTKDINDIKIKKKEVEDNLYELKKNHSMLNAYGSNKIKEIIKEKEDEAKMKADEFKNNFIKINKNNYIEDSKNIQADYDDKLNSNKNKIKTIQEENNSIENNIDNETILINNLSLILDKQKEQINKSNKELEELQSIHKKVIDKETEKINKQVNELSEKLTEEEFKKFILPREKEIEEITKNNIEQKNIVIDKINNYNPDHLIKAKKSIEDNNKSLQLKLDNKKLEIENLGKEKNNLVYPKSEINTLKLEFQEEIKKFPSPDNIDSEISDIKFKKEKTVEEKDNLILLLQSGKLNNQATITTLNKINQLEKNCTYLENEYKLKSGYKELLILGEFDKQKKSIEEKYKNKELLIIKKFEEDQNSIDNKIKNITKEEDKIKNNINSNNTDIKSIESDIDNGKENLILSLLTIENKEVDQIEKINVKYDDIKKSLYDGTVKKLKVETNKNINKIIESQKLEEEKILRIQFENIDYARETTEKINELNDKNNKLDDNLNDNLKKIKEIQENNKELEIQLKEDQKKLITILDNNNKISESTYIKHLDDELMKINSEFNKTSIANNINSQTDLLQKINSEISKKLKIQQQMKYDMENNSFNLKKKQLIFQLDNLEKEKTNFENNLKEENKKLYNKMYEEIENTINYKKNEEIQKLKLEYNNIIPTISKFEEDYENNTIEIKSMKKDFAKLDNSIQEMSKIDEKEKEIFEKNKEDLKNIFEKNLLKYNDQIKNVNYEKQNNLIIEIKKIIKQVDNEMVIKFNDINYEEEKLKIENIKDKNIKEINITHQNKMNQVKNNLKDELNNIETLKINELNQVEDSLKKNLESSNNKFSKSEEEINTKLIENKKIMDQEIEKVNSNCDAYIDSICKINDAEKEEFRKKIKSEEDIKIKEMEKKYRDDVDKIFINYNEALIKHKEEKEENFKKNNANHKKLIELNNNEFKFSKLETYNELTRILEEKELEFKNSL